MRKWIFGILGAGLVGCGGSNGGAVAQTGGGSGAERAAAAPAVEQSVVDACRACHRDELSLAGRNAETLATSIADMSAGRVAHVAPMPELSDEARIALARALSSGM